MVLFFKITHGKIKHHLVEREIVVQVTFIPLNSKLHYLEIN